jgi:MSHA biogenesis protein MshK
MSGLWKLYLGLLLVISPAVVLAGVLRDPTRIPVEVSGPTAAGEEAAAPDSGLQSVLIAPGRRAAIINGQTVEQGGKYGDSRLIKVNEGSVVLRGPQGKQVLMLFPGVEIKKSVAQPMPGKPPATKPGLAGTGKQTGNKAAVDAAPREGK